jgi:hypothetical protein
MWIRVARLRIGHFVRLIGAIPGCAALLFIPVSGCMTLGNDMQPPATLEKPAPPPQPQVEASLLPPISEPVSPSLSVVPLHSKPHKPRETHEPAVRAASGKPTVDPAQLIGKSPADVEKLMGTPARIKDDHLSREWVYTAPGCNFRVFFYPNLNAAAFRALKYGISDSNGDSLASSDACVRRILTARANAD